VLEPEVPFLDEVEKFHAGRQWITACHADDEAEVRSDEAVLRCRGCADGTIEIASGFAFFFLGASRRSVLDDL